MTAARACRFITGLGGSPFWGGVYLLWLLFPAARVLGPPAAFLCAEGLVLAVLIPLRYAVRRPRPDRGYRPGPFDPWNLYSFPSHHAARTFALAAAAGRFHPQTLPWGLALASLVGVTRVVLRRHHLSDVVAGAVLGLAAGALCAAASTGLPLSGP